MLYQQPVRLVCPSGDRSPLIPLHQAQYRFNLFLCASSGWALACIPASPQFGNCKIIFAPMAANYKISCLRRYSFTLQRDQSEYAVCACVHQPPSTNRAFHLSASARHNISISVAIHPIPPSNAFACAVFASSCFTGSPAGIQLHLHKKQFSSQEVLCILLPLTRTIISDIFLYFKII